MNCPYCGQDAPRGEILRHLADAHGEQVSTRFEEERGRMFFTIACPACGEAFEQRVKPRYRDPRFLEEFATEIRLVAFDVLLFHLEYEHAPAPGGEDADGERVQPA